MLVETLNIVYASYNMYEISKIQFKRFFNDKNVLTMAQKLRSTNPKEIIASNYEKKVRIEEIVGKITKIHF